MVSSGVDKSGNVHPLQVCPIVKCQTVLSYPHQEVHLGNTYLVTRLADDVADDANFDIHIINGSAKLLHIVASATVEGLSWGYIYEGTTYSAPGTAMTIYNLNRSSNNTSSASAKHTPTVNSLGTKIFEILINGGTGPRSAGGALRVTTELVLDVSGDYLFRITNKAGAAKDISMLLQWYEVSV